MSSTKKKHTYHIEIYSKEKQRQMPRNQTPPREQRKGIKEITKTQHSQTWISSLVPMYTGMSSSMRKRDPCLWIPVSPPLIDVNSNDSTQICAVSGDVLPRGDEDARHPHWAEQTSLRHRGKHHNEPTHAERGGYQHKVYPSRRECVVV